MRTDSGFSLIELLVVLVIIGVTLSFALLTMGDFGKKRQMMVSAEEFMNYVTFLEQQAIIEMRTFRLQFEKNTYQVFYYKPPNQWRKMPEKGVFHARTIAGVNLIRLEPTPKNGIIIYSSGQITPFKLHLDSNAEENVAVIIGQSNGQLFLQGQP